ncbi:hypothetical protein [Streptomyces sp. SID12488]|uniref:hypothetical protein n=1 Tax=Streptomyces sp. SID12488 TaxID=2706040 RepID=UPI0013DB6D43|nr:hypothetical protein [Streptomyces sp. SID12488]NEA61871.1 hypothetical protein [Streptomyces sp. SID12488]
MRTHTTRTTTRRTLVLALTTALFAVGCGSEKAGDIGTTKPRARDTSSPSAGRAQQVADAWDGSKAAKAWLKGYFPMGDAAQPPAGGFHSKDDKTAYEERSYVLRGELPATATEEGKVQWEGGGSLTLPLLDARQTYSALNRYGNSGDPHLTVTGAKLGGMTIATSRGPATVPAWLFTLEGYDEPLRRVALRPSKLPKSPIGELGESPTELMPIPRLVDVSGDGQTVTVLANHGACDDGPRVKALETGGSVVLTATVDDGKQDPDLPCADIMLEKKVRVELDRPLGDRILLDAYMGRPVPYGEGNWASPSWS